MVWIAWLMKIYNVKAKYKIKNKNRQHTKHGYYSIDYYNHGFNGKLVSSEFGGVFM